MVPRVLTLLKDLTHRTFRRTQSQLFAFPWEIQGPTVDKSSALSRYQPPHLCNVGSHFILSKDSSSHSHLRVPDVSADLSLFKSNPVRRRED